MVRQFGGFARNIDLDSDLYDELGFDSFRVTELLMQVEAALGVRLDDDDFIAVRTVRDLVVAAGGAEPSSHQTRPALRASSA